MRARVLSGEQIHRIHEASLTILERVGVRVPHPEVLDLFADAGAHVDHGAQHVCIPPDLVMNSLQQAGKVFTIYGRDVSNGAEFGTGRRNYNSVAGEALWLDNLGQERRYVTLDDVVTATRFGDVLDTITIKLG